MQMELKQFKNFFYFQFELIYFNYILNLYFIFYIIPCNQAFNHINFIIMLLINTLLILMDHHIRNIQDHMDNYYFIYDLLEDMNDQFNFQKFNQYAVNKVIQEIMMILFYYLFNNQFNLNKKFIKPTYFFKDSKIIYLLNHFAQHKNQLYQGQHILILIIILQYDKLSEKLYQKI